jgi:DNA-binding NarL/FixJ family response regulator
MKFRKPVKRLNGHNVLTQTEKTIIALLAAGLTAKEIAHARRVKLRTVHVQIRCIFEKRGIDRAGAVFTQRWRSGAARRPTSPSASGRT